MRLGGRPLEGMNDLPEMKRVHFSHTDTKENILIRKRVRGKERLPQWKTRVPLW